MLDQHEVWGPTRGVDLFSMWCGFIQHVMWIYSACGVDLFSMRCGFI
jgi:hypothetical protein